MVELVTNVVLKLQLFVVKAVVKTREHPAGEFDTKLIPEFANFGAGLAFFQSVEQFYKNGG